MSEQKGLLINYDFCTGCHTCEVACKKLKGQFGIHVLEDGPRLDVNGKWEYTYIPFPTHLCDLCAERVAEGRLPSCVHHCQAGCMEYGTTEELVRKAAAHPHSVMFAM